MTQTAPHIPDPRPEPRPEPRIDRRCVPVRKGNRVWPTQKQAARDLGVTPNAISAALARRGHLEHVGNTRGRLGNANAIMRQVKLGPLEYRSQRRASLDLGIHLATLRRFLRGGCGPEMRATIMARVMDSAKERGLF